MSRQGAPHVASHWRVADDGRVECQLCPHQCRLSEGKTGLCGVRRVAGGELRAATYGIVSSAHVDPIEKKPLYHFSPGTEIFSVGGWGCNFACTFCQNWNISQQVRFDGREYSPERIVRAAGEDGSIGIAYTYNEPLVGIEFVQDCARLARSGGLANVLVTNGFVNPVPAEGLLPLIDALNIDVKSMQESFYRTQCRGSLSPVLAFVKQAIAAGCHVELTNLLIPGLNDSDEDIRALARWVRNEAGASVPLHLSAYRPQYKLDVPSTSRDVLERAYAICAQELAYVYMGNVSVRGRGQDTLCPGCGALLVSRFGYSTRIVGVDGGKCTQCGRLADLVVHARKTRGL